MLGLPNGDASYASPVKVSWFSDNKISIKYADGGSDFSMAVSNDGKLYTFGNNAKG